MKKYDEEFSLKIDFDHYCKTCRSSTTLADAICETCNKYMSEEVREWSQINKILNGHKIHNSINAPMQIIQMKNNLKWNPELYKINV